MKLQSKAFIKGRYKIKTFKAGTKELLRESEWIDNLIVLNVNHGLNLFVKRLIGGTTYDLEITKAKIGDDNTPATDADTDLGNVLVDNILVARASETADGVALIEFFVADADLPDDSYEEFGIYCGNQLFARSIISPAYTKASGEDTQIEYTLTLNN